MAMATTATSTNRLPCARLPWVSENPSLKIRIAAPTNAQTTPTTRARMYLRGCIRWSMISVKAGPSVAMIEASIGVV